MTLQQMRYFIGAAESGSISEAAKRSFTAQSSISGAIKEVENTYGITAFVRDSKGVRLTRSGEELLIEFKGILNRLDYLDAKIQWFQRPSFRFICFLPASYLRYEFFCIDHQQPEYRCRTLSLRFSRMPHV